MPKPDNIAGPMVAILERVNRVLDPIAAEISQERISGPQWKKCECRPASLQGVWEQTIDDFERSAIASGDKKSAMTMLVCISCQSGSVPGTFGIHNFQLDSDLADAFERRAC